MNMLMTENAEQLLNELNDYEPPSDPFQGDIWQDVILNEEGYSAELTDVLCSNEQADFIIYLDKAWWNFDCNEQTREWKVYYLGTSMEYRVSEDMVGCPIDMGQLVEKLRHELQGFNVKHEPAVYSLSEEVRLYFGNKIDEIFQRCVEEVLDVN